MQKSYSSKLYIKYSQFENRYFLSNNFKHFEFSLLIVMVVVLNTYALRYQYEIFNLTSYMPITNTAA